MGKSQKVHFGMGEQELIPEALPSPCYIVDEHAIKSNLKILADIQEKSGAKILLALKAFSMFAVAPLVSKYLRGVCASGLNEAKLGREEFGGEVHTYAAAYKESEILEIAKLSNHMVFNSFSQWERFKDTVLEYQKQNPGIKYGLRINPEHSEGATPIYDPCSPCSRMGIPLKHFKDQDLSGISGIHFHTLCEQNFAPLERTLDVIEHRFGHILKHMKWVNFGGGHHITREDYDREALVRRIKAFQKKHKVQVYLEPGEAIALNSGVLVGEVLDTIHNGMDLAILDISATCHMPDVLEMPYRPSIQGAGEPGEKPYTYRLGGPSCLAGDVIGDYSFEHPLQIGDKLVFEDMAIYTMVKNTTFNGINLPAIALWNSKSGELKLVKEFGYSDFKNRLS